jgi:hypothetical protein
MSGEPRQPPQVLPLPRVVTLESPPRPLGAINDGFVAATLSGAFLLAVFFPYVQLVPLGTDTQPYALLLAVLVFLTVRNRAMPGEIVLLGIVFAFSLLVMLGEGIEFLALRSVSNYASLFFISFASYALLKVRGGFPAPVLKFVVLVWFVVGAVQTFVYSEFLVDLVNRGERTAGVGGRGVVGISPEPTHYAMFCLFLLLLVVLHRRRLGFGDRTMLITLLVVQVVFFAKSATGVLCLAILLFYYLAVNVLSARRLVPTLAVALLLVGALAGISRLGLAALEGSRMFRIVELFRESPAMLLLVDESVSDRFFQIYFSFTGTIENSFFPRGYTAWLDYLSQQYSEFPWWVQGRILSGYGSAFFELGLVAVLVPMAITLAFYRFYRHDRRTFVAMVLFLHTILLTAIPLAFPPLAFILGYLAYYARFGGETRPPVAAPSAGEVVVPVANT